jgi:glycosyltransferase involved in cell wall biosynthesis
VVVTSKNQSIASYSATESDSDAASEARRRGSSRKLRLLVVVTRLDVGGVPEHIVILLGHLAATYDVTVACRDVISPHRIRLERAGVRIELIDFARLPNPIRDLRALFQLAAFIRREHFDIVHSHMSKGALIGGLAARLSNVPLVLNTAHNFGALALPNPVLRNVFRWYDRMLFAITLDQLVTVSKCQRDQIIAEGVIRADKVTTIWNGIDTSGFRERALCGPTREALGIPEDSVVVVTVARLVWFKAIDILIEAAALVKSTTKVHFLVVGDGVLRPRLQQLVEARGLNDRVRLLGERHDVAGLLALSDIFALPSASEGMPIAIMEAMAVGLPVVATAVDGTPELVLDGQTGTLVRPGDPRAFADALDPLLGNAELRQKLGQAGRQRIDTKFSDIAMAATTDQMYRRLEERAGGHTISKSEL